MAPATPTEGERGRKQFLETVTDELYHGQQALTITGHTGDQFEAKDRKAVRDVIVAHLRKQFDTVLVYNAATCNVTIQSEREEPLFLFAQLRDNQPPCITDPTNGSDIAENLLKPEVLKQHGPYDEAFFRFARCGLDSTIDDLCIVIDHASSMLPSKDCQRMPAHDQQELNTARLFDLHQQILASQKNWSLVLLNHENEDIAVLNNTIPSLNVPLPSRAETSAILPAKFRDDKTAQMLAQGARIRQLEDIVQRTKEDYLLEVLRAFKTREIEEQTGGLVTGMVQSIPDDQIAMSDAKREWFSFFAEKLVEGSDLVPQGLLLMGPPGTGKSYDAQYLASLMGVPCLQVGDTGSESYVGIQLKKWKTIIETAIAQKPCVLFVDEIDKHIPRTEGSGGTAADNDMAQVTAYLQSMIGSKAMEGVVIIGACNNIERMNEALVRSGRLGLRAAVLPPESDSERLSVLRAVYAQLPELDGLLDEKALAVIATQTEGATPAELKQLLKLAGIDFGLDRAETLLGAVRLHIDKCPPERNADFQRMQETAIAQATVSFEAPDGTPSGPASEALDAHVLLETEQQRLQEKEAALDKRQKQANEAEQFVLTLASKLHSEISELTTRGQESVAEIAGANEEAAKSASELHTAIQQSLDATTKLVEAVQIASESDGLQVVIDKTLRDRPLPSQFSPVEPLLFQRGFRLPDLPHKPYRPAMLTVRGVRSLLNGELLYGGHRITVDPTEAMGIPGDSLLAIAIPNLPATYFQVLHENTSVEGQYLLYMHGRGPDGHMICSSFTDSSRASQLFALDAFHHILGIVPWEKHQGRFIRSANESAIPLDMYGIRTIGKRNGVFPPAGPEGLPYEHFYAIEPDGTSDNIIEVNCERWTEYDGPMAGDLFSILFKSGLWYCDGWILHEGEKPDIAIATCASPGSARDVSAGDVQFIEESDGMTVACRNRWGDYDPQSRIPFNIRNPFRVFGQQLQQLDRALTGTTAVETPKNLDMSLHRLDSVTSRMPGG